MNPQGDTCLVLNTQLSLLFDLLLWGVLIAFQEYLAQFKPARTIEDKNKQGAFFIEFVDVWDTENFIEKQHVLDGYKESVRDLDTLPLRRYDLHSSSCRAAACARFLRYLFAQIRVTWSLIPKHLIPDCYSRNPWVCLEFTDTVETIGTIRTNMLKRALLTFFVAMQLMTSFWKRHSNEQ
jgi:hypothetical protein